MPQPAYDASVTVLVFFEAWFSFELVASYLPGRENVLADDLSCNRLTTFLSKAQLPDPELAPLHQDIPGLLLDHAGWNSPHWMTFAAIVTAEWQSPLQRPTSQG